MNQPDLFVPSPIERDLQPVSVPYATKSQEVIRASHLQSPASRGQDLPQSNHEAKSPMPSGRTTTTQRVADLFRAAPDVWIDGMEIERVGGMYAWRTRVSDCRTQLGMVIENRQRRIRRDDGTRFSISEYMLISKPDGVSARNSSAA